eukprot:GHVU01102940.1.p1 GENE.GHVU01102940.1~~GHVU01102940.1.p1  ORF type:complete len:588 (-),score=31.88 GHVU01102940.1:263-2026(-)
MPREMRELFVVVLQFHRPVEPGQLFHKYALSMSEDFPRRLGIVQEEDRVTALYLDIKQRLQRQGRDITQYRIQEPSQESLERVYLLAPCYAPVGAMRDSRGVIAAELLYDRPALQEEVQRVSQMLTEEQTAIMDRVHTLENQEGTRCLSVTAAAGTGKTLLLTHILNDFRSRGMIALGVAQSGIAASLLPNGRTFHSRFKCPLHLSIDMLLAITPDSPEAELLRRCVLIVWDEISMAHKWHMEALDRLLRDIRRRDRNSRSELPFGGVFVIVAGDWAQILPIDKSDDTMGVAVTVKRSMCWPAFERLPLTQNMRMVGTSEETRAYIRWVQDMGNGRLQTQPRQDIMLHQGTTGPLCMNTAVDWTYPDFAARYMEPEYLRERLLMTPLHESRKQLNEMMCDMIPEVETISYSTCQVSADWTVMHYTVSPEYLASLEPPNFPPHELRLKRGMVVMLLRNLDAPNGLCNGTRLIVVEVKRHPWLLVARFLNDPARTVYIPRIALNVDADAFGFEWSRRQFPVMPGYAVTINKAQGQTVEHAGVYLSTEVFGHGFLYVAATRCRNPDRIRFFVQDHERGMTVNIVIREVLE